MVTDNKRQIERIDRILSLIREMRESLIRTQENLQKAIDKLEKGSPKKLPVFKGYTVDERLQEFRKVEYGKTVEFIPFDSPKGQNLLSDMRAEIPF